MRVATKWAVAALCLLGTGLLAPAAQAAPAATGVDEVVRALGLSREPADYVVLVDTSGSMNAGGRYARVRTELGTLVRGLDAEDRVSLYTFDSSAQHRFRGAVGDRPDAVLARLPKTAAGKHTDIGAAIAAGLQELERPETRRLTALILITDGVLDAPGSDFANVKSSAWKQLRTRAEALAADHQVAGYAVSLQATTDAGLLKKVLPKATEVKPGDVGARFADLGNDLIRLRAADALRNELAQPIQVTWTGDLGAAAAAGGPADVTLEIASPYVHVPVELAGFTAQASPGLTVQLDGLPETVELDPSGRVSLPARVTVSGTPAPDAQVGLTAKVTSSWQKALTKDLGLDFAPALAGTAPVSQPPLRLPPTLLPTIGTVAGIAAAALLLFWLAATLLLPPMSGLLTVRRDGREVAEVVLGGRRLKLAAPVAAPELAGLGGSVAGARGAGRGERAVRVDARLGEARTRAVIQDGGFVAFGPFELGYTSGRRRILEKIGLVGESTEAEAAE
jgi:hypothetical protein